LKESGIPLRLAFKIVRVFKVDPQRSKAELSIDVIGLFSIKMEVRLGGRLCAGIIVSPFS
jgi:hypothetical protein